MAREPILHDELWDESKHFVEALNREDPLHCALMAGAAVEKSLIVLLSAFFVEGSQREAGVFDMHGALESVGKCADIAYWLGFISKSALNNLKLVAKVRNRFAHSHVPIDFADKDVVKHCKKLEPEKGMDVADWQSLPHRVRFSFTAAALFSFIMRTASGVTRRLECTDFWSTPKKVP